MEEELLNLSTDLEKEGHDSRVGKFLEKNSANEIVSTVTRAVQQGKENAVPLIKSILNVFKDNSPVHVELCTELYKKLYGVLQKNEISEKSALSIISFLLIEVDALQRECLAYLASYFVDSIKEGTFQGGKASDLLPKVLAVINASEKICSGENTMKGSEFKSHVVNSLCTSRWKPEITVTMATMFQDVPLLSDELKFLITKICRILPEIELSDQPALVFQLLRLSSKGHKNLVLEGVTNYYNAQDDKNRGKTIMIDSEDLMSDATCIRTLRQVEGTVILHILQAVEQDQDLGRELIKYFKNLQQLDAVKTISPFNVLLLLSVSQLHHCEDQVFDFVKTTIFKCIRDEMKQQQSLWIQDCFPVTMKTADLVLEAVEHSTYDWDHVIQSLVHLGFDLMESYGPRLVFGQISEAPIPDESLMTPQQLTCKLGRKLLLKTFKAHEVVRYEILDHVFKNITTRSTQPVGHYLELLSDTVYSAPQLLLESCSKVQQVVIELAHLHPITAQSLLNAIQPLLKLSPLLKDSLLLVLRKAMFSRLLDARKIGAMGFLTILRSFRVIGGLPSSQVSQPISLSQIQVDVHSRYNSASNEALCLEILGNLRRCFTQQADVRLSVYQGLFEVLHRNSQLRNALLDMLLSHVQKYYEPNEENNSPPLRLDRCIQMQGEQVYLTEPLSHLLRCVQLCVRKGIEIEKQMATNDDEFDDDNDEDDSQLSLTQLKSILANLVKRMIDVNLEDFELDKSADFSLTNSVGVKNNIYAILLIGVYEILMEYVCETGKFSPESCSLIIQLFAGYSKLTSFVKEKSGGKKGKPSQSKSPTSLMSVECVINMLKAFIDNRNKDQEDGVNILRQNKDFFPHLVSVACQKLDQVANKGFAEGEVRNEDKALKSCCTLGRLFYLHYVENQVVNDASDRDKNATSQCLEALGQVISIASSRGDQASFHCLSQIEKDSEDEEKEYVNAQQVVEKLNSYVKKFQRLVATILNESQERQNWKEMSTLLSIISQLMARLPGSSEEFQQANDWVLNMCNESVEDASCCKQLMSMLLTGRKIKSLPPLLLNVCQDLHTQFGHIDKDQEVEDKTHYTVTKASACPPSAILMLALAKMDQEIDDIDWVMKRHKARVTASASCLEDDSLGATQLEQMDRSMCTRLGLLVNSCIELCHSAITSKLNSHALLKSLTKLYTTLSNLAKYFLSLYTSKTGHMGTRFEKLIRLVGQQLTQPAYCIISYVQMTESDQSSVDGEKKKKKEAPNNAQAGMAKAIQQMKVTSNLIFAIEQLEKFLIQLSKKSKVNLMESFKLSTSRDFRINAEVINKNVEEGVSSSDEEEKNEEDENNQEKENNENSEEEENDDSSNEAENDPPPPKRSKLGKKK